MIKEPSEPSPSPRAGALSQLMIASVEYCRSGMESTRVGSKGLKRLEVWLRGGGPTSGGRVLFMQEPGNSSIQTLVRLRSSQNDKVAVGGTQEGFLPNWDFS